MKHPNFFIIGAPKCGTTSLTAWLGEHPKIYMSPIKEPHFYSTDLNHRWATTRREYQALFEEAGPEHLAVGEASVYYLFSQVAVPEIEKHHPRAKYIVMVRNPVDMAYSFHEQRLVSQAEHITDFAEAWALSPERRQGRYVTRWCGEPKLLDYESICKLGQQLKRLFSIVPHERVLVLALEEIRAAPRREYVKALDFLGVEDDGRHEFPVQNAAKELRWPRLHRTLQVISRQWVAAKRVFGIPPHRFALGIQKKISQRNFKYRLREPLDEEIKKQLDKFYLEEKKTMRKFVNYYT